MARYPSLGVAAAVLVLLGGGFGLNAALTGQDSAQAPALDVPYVPTGNAVVEKMLELGAVGPDDYVIDLGSGDGRIPIAAAKRGARGFGVDIDPERIREATANAKAAGVADRVTFRRQDLFRTPIAEASVLTMYLLPSVNMKLRPRILAELKPGTHVVSHAFDMGDWVPDRSAETEGATVYQWIVPARVAGDWTLTDARDGTMDLTIEQTFQTFTGRLTRRGQGKPIEQTYLTGDLIRFVADAGDGRRLYEGRVRGNAIEPVAKPATLAVRPATGWRLTRAD